MRGPDSADCDEREEPPDVEMAPVEGATADTEELLEGAETSTAVGQSVSAPDAEDRLPPEGSERVLQDALSGAALGLIADAERALAQSATTSKLKGETSTGSKGSWGPTPEPVSRPYIQPGSEPSTFVVVENDILTLDLPQELA